jgi:hypothetical protein
MIRELMIHHESIRLVLMSASFDMDRYLKYFASLDGGAATGVLAVRQHWMQRPASCAANPVPHPVLAYADPSHHGGI